VGYGNYSYAAHEALVKKRERVAVEKVFTQRSCHPLMDPRGVRARESRDSADHPNSIAIAFMLDVSGSMGEIPALMATQLLPRFMKILQDVKVPDPQVMFAAVSDANCNRAPLQVGQFESTAELMDKWLTLLFLEGGGQGPQESYELAMYFLAMHTSMDCFDKRGRRGYMFMTGDEVPYPALSRKHVESVLGDRIDDDLKTEQVVAELVKTYRPFFVIPDLARRRACERTWRDMIGDHVLCMETPQDVCLVTAGAVALCEKAVSDVDALGRALRDAGTPPDRVASTIRTLKPLAEVTR
jgi:hypothetical protein